ncbi:hypothetical protein V8C86DRAFT_2932093 [Haematococcus lacustris]
MRRRCRSACCPDASRKRRSSRLRDRGGALSGLGGAGKMPWAGGCGVFRMCRAAGSNASPAAAPCADCLPQSLSLSQGWVLGEGWRREGGYSRVGGEASCGSGRAAAAAGGPGVWGVPAAPSCLRALPELRRCAAGESISPHTPSAAQPWPPGSCCCCSWWRWRELRSLGEGPRRPLARRLWPGLWMGLGAAGTHRQAYTQ